MDNEELELLRKEELELLRISLLSSNSKMSDFDVKNIELLEKAYQHLKEKIEKRKNHQ